MEKQKQTRGFTRVQDVVNAITGLMRDAGAEGDVVHGGNDKEVRPLHNLSKNIS